MQRRNLDFSSSDEVIADIQRLQAAGYEKCGNWNLTQICQHLTETMKGGMDGFGFRLPWVLRATVAKWAFHYGLRKRKLGSGLPTFKMLKPTHENAADDDQVIENCIETCRRAESFTGPIEDYPLLNDPSVEDWRQFMWIHAAHHLSFLVPRVSATGHADHRDNVSG